MINTKIKNRSNTLFMAWLPIIMFVVIMTIRYLLNTYGTADDAAFSQVDLSNGIFTWLFDRYHVWTSRLIIEFFMIIIVKLPSIIFIFLNVAVFTMGVVFATKIVFGSLRFGSSLVTVLVFLCYPIEEMATAGHVATCLNYLWPVSFALVGLHLIKKFAMQEEIPLIQYFGYLFATLFAANSEQGGAIFFAAYLLLTGYLLYQKKPLHWKFLIMLILVILSFVFIMTTPGNKARSAAEVINWFPEFANLRFMNKLDLGLSTALYRIFVNYNFTYIILCILLVVLAFLKPKNNWFLLSSSCLAIATISIQNLFVNTETMEKFKGAITVHGTLVASRGIKQFIPLIIVLLLLACLLLTLYFAFSQTEKKVTVLIILLAGVASRTVIGFSPTIWASGNRTSIFLDFGLALCTIFVASEIFRTIQVRVKELQASETATIEKEETIEETTQIAMQ